METCIESGKFKYKNKIEAEDAMYNIYRKSGENIFGSYICEYCMSLHLTSQYDNRSIGCKERFNKLSKSEQRNLEKLYKSFVTKTLPHKEMVKAIASLPKTKPKVHLILKNRMVSFFNQNYRIITWIIIWEICKTLTQ